MAWRRAGLACLLLVGAVLATRTADAEETPAVRLSEQQAVDLATELFGLGRVEEAKRLILPLRQAADPPPQVIFLSAQLALHEGRVEEAIAELRHLLAEDGSRLRVRLELAHALFRNGDLDGARRHFEIALGSPDLPEATRRRVTAYLREITARSASWGFSLVVGADSNPNLATASESVVLLGQNFILSEDARADGAIGALASLHGRQAFGADRLAFLRAYLEVRDYPARSADFAYAQLTAGRSLAAGESLLSAEAGVHGARYQGRTLYGGELVQAGHTRRLLERANLVQTLQWKRLDYDAPYDYLAGHQVWLGHDLRYAVAPNAALDASLWLGGHRARDEASSYRGGELRVGYLHEFRGGLNTELRLAAGRNVYDGVQPLFETAREDRQRRLELALTRRDWVLFGHAPWISVTATRNRSTIPLFDYRRKFVGGGLSREF